MNLTIRRTLAPFARALAPGITCCRHCGLPWKFVQAHDVEYRPSRFFFVTCESCWPLLRGEDIYLYTLEMAHGTGFGWRWNEAWDEEAGRLALAAALREAERRQNATADT